MVCHITVDVQAEWTDVPPIYRIYVDQDLLTERTFGWNGTQTYITEIIACELETGVHTLRLENCNKAGRVELRNFVFKNENKSTTIRDRAQITFTVDTLLNVPGIEAIYSKQDLLRLEHQRLVRQQLL